MNDAIVNRAGSHRLRFGLRTILAVIAFVSVVLGLLDLWLRAPYRAEQRAAAALTRLGGKIVLVDHPRAYWLRNYVSKKWLNMDVAAAIDLSHSRVTDVDLDHLRAFQHFGVLNLSDTQVSNAGLKRLPDGVFAYRYIDLSRTRVTDVSMLFGKSSLMHPSGLKLAGTHVSRVGPEARLWCPLGEVDLSDTDVTDHSLATFSDGLVCLNTIILAGTDVTDRGLATLHRFPSLIKLDLRDTKVTPEGVARLQATWKGSGPLTIKTGSRKTSGKSTPATPATSRAGYVDF